MKSSERVLAHERDTIDCMRTLESNGEMATNQAFSLRVGSSVRKGQMRVEILKNVRIAPVFQVALLPSGQFGGSRSHQFVRMHRSPEGVECADGPIGHGLEAGRIERTERAKVTNPFHLKPNRLRHGVSSDIRIWSGGDMKNWSTLSLLQ